MGAVVVSSMSTFVSCKDYDDDINSLQTQVNSLSSLINAKETTINSTISTMQTTLNGLTSLESTLTGKISDGNAATLAAARQAVADAQAALQTAINAKANASDVAALVTANANQDAAILTAQAAADQALNQLGQLSSLQTVVEGVSQSINTATQDLTQAKLDLADLTQKYNTMNEDLKTAISDIADLKIAVAGQAAALEAIGGQTGLTQVQTDVASLLQKLTALEEKVNNLTKTQSESVAKDIEDINVSVKALQAAQGTFADMETLNTVKGDVTTMQTSVKAIEDEIIPQLNTITTALAKALRSLVFQPYLYVDGVEAIEYPYLRDTAKAMAPAQVMTRQRTYGQFAEDYTKTIRDAAQAKFPKLAPLRDYIQAVPLSEEFFGPTWGVAYHMNPSRSTTAWADIKGWNRRDAEIITRSDAGKSNKIVTAEKYADGTDVFSNVNGTLTVGLRIDDVAHLANHAVPTEGTGRPGYTYENDKAATNYQYDDMIALQAYSGKDTVITSDYAMVYPEKAYLEGIVWTKHLNKIDFSNLNYDEKCAWPAPNKVHVWDAPAKALAAAGDASVYPDIELYYNDENGICLKDLLGIHLVKESKTIAGKNNPYCIAFNDVEFGRWGLSYEFQLVGYSIDGNSTIDSNYAEFTDADDKGVSKTGTIRAKNVKEDGTTIDTQSATSVDREPLVRVLVKRGDRVVLDGYILIHITKVADKESELIVDNYPEQNAEFKLCNDVTVFSTNWSEFSYYVLTQKLDNMTKETFDAQYGLQYNGVPDLMGTVQPVALTASPVTLADNSTRYDDVQLFEDTEGKKSTARDLPGYVSYFHNSVGTTNHRFEWVVSADELEEYTHDRADLPRKITKYFRYTGKAGAQYKYIYVKMTFNLDRAKIAESGVSEKNKNYWYSEAGEDALEKGIFDAVVWNPWYPQDGGDTRTYQQDLVSTFAANKVQFTNTTGLASAINSATGTTKAKFYFAPVNFTITSQSGVEYTITPRSSNLDESWNSFVCKYLRWENDGTEKVVHDGTNHNLHWKSTDVDGYTTHKWGTAAQNKEIHEKCAIDYNKGVYANNKLYAVTNYGKSTAVYRLIATLNQNITTGQMKLTWNTLAGDPDDIFTREVLNAIGYVPNHENIINATAAKTVDGFDYPAYKTGELHTMVGIVAQNGCDVAVNINELVTGENNANAGTFYVSWQRPINVSTKANPMVDAKNNGDYIYTVDFLKLFDWRGPVYGKMYDENQWLWSYYGIRGLRIDTRPAQVYTNMHQSDLTKFVKLNTITTMAQLGVLNTDGTISIGGNVTIPIDVTAYNAANLNDGILAAMGIKPADNDVKRLFAGGLFYANNGDNVQQFDVIVPVTVLYDWGEFVSDVKVHIDRTLGH